MSTFLQLTQRTAREAGISGSGPVSVASQTGEMGRVVNWVISAWDDIQMSRPNWYWMRGTFTLPLVASQQAYTYTEAGITTRFGMWDTNSLRLYKTSTSDEQGIGFLDYESFRDTYKVGPQTNMRPTSFSIDPQLQLLFGGAPDAVYTVNGEYFKANQTLAANSDIPEMPAQYHMAIVYRALMMYARFESAAEIYDDAKENYTRIITRLELNQMPDVDPSGPLL